MTTMCYEHGSWSVTFIYMFMQRKSLQYSDFPNFNIMPDGLTTRIIKCQHYYFIKASREAYNLAYKPFIFYYYYYY